MSFCGSLLLAHSTNFLSVVFVGHIIFLVGLFCAPSPAVPEAIAIPRLIMPLNSYFSNIKGGSVAEWLACWTRRRRAPVQIAVATLSCNSLRKITKQQNIASSPLNGCVGSCRPGGK